MYKKIVLLLALTLVAKSQEQNDPTFVEGGTYQNTTDENGKVVSRKYKVAERRPFTRAEILDELSCFSNGEENCYFSQFNPDRWESEVEAVVRGGMEDGKRYEAYFVMKDGKYQFQFNFWRVEDDVFGSLGKRNNGRPALQGSNVSNTPVFDEKLKFYRTLTDEGCFKMLPKGCKYSGQSSEYFQELCKGYDEVAENLKKDIILVSAVINTQNGDEVNSVKGENNTVESTLGPDGTMNPAIVAGDFAKCLSRTTRNNTIQMDCAVKGIPMDHSWAIIRLNNLAEKLRLKGMTNVTVDTDTLTLNYDEDLGLTDQQNVTFNDGDFEVN